MANYEFKTTQCYPHAATESMYKNFYEGCGWEILDMDRKQEYKGQSSDGTKHFSTQTHIKLRRDKSMKNYSEIETLSAEAEAYFDTTPKKSPSGKYGFYLFIIGALILIIGIIGKSMPLDIAGGAVLAFGVLLLAIGAKKNKALKASYLVSKAAADEAFEKCKKLVDGARNS